MRRPVLDLVHLEDEMHQQQTVLCLRHADDMNPPSNVITSFCKYISEGNYTEYAFDTSCTVPIKDILEQYKGLARKRLLSISLFNCNFMSL